MYSMPSTPLTCCSIGAATVSATTWALAPGYWIATATAGGVIGGDCASRAERTPRPPPPLVGRDRPVDDQQRRVRLADRQPDAHEHPWRKQPDAALRLGVGEDAADRDASGRRVHLVVDEVDIPLVREAVLALQAHVD